MWSFYSATSLMIANPIYPPKYQQEILFVTFSIILSCGIFGYAVNQRMVYFTFSSFKKKKNKHTQFFF